MREHVEEPLPELPRGEKVLVAASLAAPLFWLVQLGAAFWMVGALCQTQARWPLHLVTGVALVLTLASIRLCWRARTRPPEGSEPARRVAAGGAVLGAFFALLILALEIPMLLLHPCL